MSHSNFFFMSALIISAVQPALAQGPTITAPTPTVQPLSDSAKKALSQDQKPQLAMLAALGANASNAVSSFFGTLGDQAEASEARIRAQMEKDRKEEQRLAGEAGLTVEEFRLRRKLEAGTEIAGNWQRYKSRPAVRPRGENEKEIIPSRGSTGLAIGYAVAFNETLAVEQRAADQAYTEQGQKEAAELREQSARFLTVAGAVAGVQADQVTEDMLHSEIRDEVIRILNTENPSIDAALVPAFNNYLQTLPPGQNQGPVAEGAGFTRQELEALILSPYKDGVSFKSDAKKLSDHQAIPLGILRARIVQRTESMTALASEKDQAGKARIGARVNELDALIRGMTAQNKEDEDWIKRIEEKKVALLADPAPAKVEVAKPDPAQSEPVQPVAARAGGSEIRTCNFTNGELADAIVDFQMREKITVYDNKEWWQNLGAEPGFCNQPAPQAVYDAFMQKLDQEIKDDSENRKAKDRFSPTRATRVAI